MPRPKLKISLPFAYRFLEAFTLFGVLVLVALPIYYWNQLPEQVPINSGKTTSKAIMLFEPIFGMAIYILIFFLKKAPHRLNYTVKITEQNAANQYAIALKILVWMNLLTIAILAIISYSSIQSSLGNHSNTGLWVISGLLIWMTAIMVYSIIKMKKEQ